MAAKRHKAEEIVTKLHHVLGRDPWDGHQPPSGSLLPAPLHYGAIKLGELLAQLF